MSYRRPARRPGHQRPQQTPNAQPTRRTATQQLASQLSWFEFGLQTAVTNDDDNPGKVQQDGNAAEGAYNEMMARKDRRTPRPKNAALHLLRRRRHGRRHRQRNR